MHVRNWIQHLGLSGSATRPGYAFLSDRALGFFRKAANQLGVTVNGSEIGFFSSTGLNNMPIGATTASTGAFTTQTNSGKATGATWDANAITSVASAATTDIGAAATSELTITGTTTITSFGTSNAGIRRRGTFAGALTLTHNATSLILPGGANITTAANDRWEALSLGAGNWIVTYYQKADGTSVSGGGITQTTGSAPYYAARAFVAFNGTGVVAIYNSSNVTSITDNGTGNYTVNFTTAMADANYTAIGASGGGAGNTIGESIYFGAVAAGSIQIYCNNTNTAANDVPYCYVAIFR